ncbi:hypothetical protein SASPL_150526 [Salvia splendens]|uniref:RRM domain-containing protein n=1 Tax=Salvia splendens TaxID=180675 RepID=A0A8X8Z1T9_SALSN|nr:hypothetical protein SASPL_150526 [Salvia splendens]
MAVMENAGANAIASSNCDNDVVVNGQEAKPADQSFHKMPNGHHQLAINGNGGTLEKKMDGEDDDGGEGFKRDMRDLEEMLSKLNPMAKEFVPPSLRLRWWVAQVAGAASRCYGCSGCGRAFWVQHYWFCDAAAVHGFVKARIEKNGFVNGKRRMNSRTSMAQREDVIRRTVYVSDIDHQVTEEQLAALFIGCGQVVDCRVCGEEGARNALSLAGTMLGYYPVKVLPSKTAIAPVNPTLLPRSEDEREMCARTIYCTDIDKKVNQADVKLFFQCICGEVYLLRLLGDYHHSTRIAFVEFVMDGVSVAFQSCYRINVLISERFTGEILDNRAESAIAALNCTGAVLGSLPIRVSPSKTPVRPCAPRQSMH